MAAAFACAGTALLASPALATTETFNYTGAAQTWTVPAGVTSASFDLFGAQGGLISTNSPGLGGHATATIPLTAGDSIQVNVGGRGEGFPSSTTAGAGGFNGGGNGVAQGGGGASDIRIGGRPSTSGCWLPEAAAAAGTVSVTGRRLMEVAAAGSWGQTGSHRPAPPAAPFRSSLAEAGRRTPEAAGLYPRPLAPSAQAALLPSVAVAVAAGMGAGQGH